MEMQSDCRFVKYCAQLSLPSPNTQTRCESSLSVIPAGPQARGSTLLLVFLDLTSEVVGDGKRSLRARAVFSTSEISTITGPSDERASAECIRELSCLASCSHVQNG